MADYTISLKDISGEGRFPCPKCKSPIDPDDDNGENYTILEAKVTGDSIKLIIHCNHCHSTIELVGFP